jgi:uncharacterized lipoprotein YmbA
MTRETCIPVAGAVVMAAMILMLQPGCSGSKPSRFYVLSPLALEEAAQQDLSVGIGPLRFPDYLLRPQIAIQTNANQLDYAEYDRWAEPLDENFSRILASNLARLIPSDQVHVYPWLETLRVHFQMLVRVRRFGQTEAGQVILNVSWSILDDTTGEHLVQRYSTYSRPAPPGEPTDYAAVAAAMSELLGQFSQDAAQALRELRQ